MKTTVEIWSRTGETIVLKQVYDEGTYYKLSDILDFEVYRSGDLVYSMEININELEKALKKFREV